MDYDNNLIRLVYSSKHTDNFEFKDAIDIENCANRNNPIIGITGMLFCNSKGFLQVIEGPRIHVSNLFLKIAQDPRHKDPLLINVSDIQKRMFDVWAMRVIDSTIAEENVIDFLRKKYKCFGLDEFPITNDVDLSTMFLYDLQMALLNHPSSK